MLPKDKSSSYGMDRYTSEKILLGEKEGDYEQALKRYYSFPHHQRRILYNEGLVSKLDEEANLKNKKT